MESFSRNVYSKHSKKIQLTKLKNETSQHFKKIYRKKEQILPPSREKSSVNAVQDKIVITTRQHVQSFQNVLRNQQQANINLHC